jgi:hypothetical protein
MAMDSRMVTTSTVLQEILDQLSHYDMRDGRYEGDRATRLVDASYALHRAVIALDGVELEDTAVECRLDVGDVSQLADDLSNLADDLSNGVVDPIFRASLAMQGVLQRVADPELSQSLEAAIGQLDDVLRQTRELMFGLSSSADEG